MIFHVGRERHPPQPSSVKIFNTQPQCADTACTMRCGKNTTGVRTPPCDPPAAMRRNEGVRFKTDSLVLIGRLPLFLHDRHIIDEETPLAGLRLVRLTHDRDRIFRFEVGNLHHDSFHTISVNTAGSSSAVSSSYVLPFTRADIQSIFITLCHLV